MAESILVTGKKISSMELVTNVTGIEKIPTGQPDDLAITPNQIADHTITRGDLASHGDLSQVEVDLTTQIATLAGDVAAEDNSIRGLIAAEEAARIAADNLKVDKEGSVSSVAGRVGDVVLAPSDVLVDGFGSQEDVNKYVAKPFLSGYTYGLGERVVLNDGEVVKSLVDGNVGDPNADMVGWVSVVSDSLATTVQTFTTPEAGVDPVTGVADGTYFNVRSSSDESYGDEYQNVGGSAVATGKRYLSALGVEQQEKPASTIKDASGKTHQQLTSFKPNFLNDTSALPSTDVTEILNAWTKNADDNQVSSLEIPMNGLDYTLSNTIVIQEPLAIVGDKGATYDRGRGKGGWFLLGTGLTHAFDLGNYRTLQANVYDRDTGVSPNPSDYWTVKNIGVKPAEGVTPRTQDGIRLTTQTNGPDRALQLDNLSMRRLDKAVFIERQYGSGIVSVASLNVENSVICDSNYGIYCDGRSFQSAIENNQIEQNYEASIWGRFDGPFRAVNNVIEGATQKYGIVFRNTEAGQANSSVQAILESHYFEALKEACFDIEASNGSAFWLRGNRNYGVLTKDYCIVRKDSRTTIYNEEFERITLEDGCFLNLGSELTRNPDYSFYFRPTTSSFSRVYVLHDLDKLNRFDSEHITVNPSISHSITKVRDQLCYGMTIQAPFPAVAGTYAVGDIVEINVLAYCDDAGSGLSLTGTVGGVLATSSGISLSAGKWVSSTALVRCAAAGSGLSFTPQFNASTAVGAIVAGISVKNHGQVTVGDKYLIRPVQPQLHTISGKHAQKFEYAGNTVPANGGTRKFDLVVSKYGEVGNLVQAALSVYVPDLEVSAVLRAGGVVQVTLKNPTTTDIVVPACQVRVIVL